MANLFTSHDPYHIHKSLGLASLLNYIFRFYYLVIYGTAFPKHEPLIQAICCVLLHGILSASSMFLPLPVKRNFSSPMIWPEFRLHSITFAMRHVIATTLTLSRAWPPHPIGEAFMQFGLIIITSQCASWITKELGDKEKRTTNSMSYPSWITQDMQNGIKDMYIRAQFGATKTIILGDPTLTYFPLLGIQMAPLLMTLVRKGKITSITYHRIYSLSLTMSYVALFVRLWAQPDKILIVSLAFCELFPLSGLRRIGISRLSIWFFYVNVHFVLAPILKECFGMSSVVVACATVVILFPISTSESSLLYRAFWPTFVVLGLAIKNVYFVPDQTFEETYFDRVLLKIAPLMLLPSIIKQIQNYRCLFFDQRKSFIKSMVNNVQTSRPTIDRINTAENKSTGARDSKFFNS